MFRRLLPLLALGGVLCLHGEARAQERVDQNLNEQVRRWKEGHAFDLMKEKNFGTSKFDNRKKKVTGKKIPFAPQKFDSKTFLANGYRNDKSFWLGDFQYSVKPADTTPRPSLQPGRTYRTASVPVKAVPVLRDYPDPAVKVPTRDYRGQERQKMATPLTPEQAASKGYRGSFTPMTIEDIRELLNKSK